MNYGAILAGGVGKRMQSGNLPKQFLDLNGKPVILWTIERLTAAELFDEIYIAVHPDWMDTLQDLMKQWKMDTSHIRVISGGKERLDTIRNVIDAIIKDHGIDSSDKILIHDAVRPFITNKIMEDSLNALDQYPAVVAAIPATDTMLWIEEGTKVDSMPTRSKLFHGQAPDSFRLQVLADSLDALSEEDKKVITGTAQICLVQGIEIHTVPGDPRNIKLTTPGDMYIAEGLMKEEV